MNLCLKQNNKIERENNNQKFKNKKNQNNLKFKNKTENVDTKNISTFI